MLLEDRSAGLDFGQLVRATDLSAYQVRSGLGALSSRTTSGSITSSPSSTLSSDPSIS
ncbi:hypothetical protein SLNHY_1264 [Streptomyces albus]|nr:hypothetical protein SLNHY_1264 [Streptomyces albus]